MNKPTRAVAALATLLLTLAPAALSADSPTVPPVPWNSYNYGIWDESVPAMPVYECERVINGFDMGVGALNGARDLCNDSAGNIYILDSGNKRIVVLNEDLKLTSVIDRFRSGGKLVSLVEPQGIYVDIKGTLYIADRGLKSVLVCKLDGTVTGRIAKPVTDLISEATEFLPNKVLVDHAGVIYVLSYGSNEGAYTFDPEGNFLGFFGSNKVSVNAKLRSDRIWRMFATKAQRSRMYRYVPTEYANFAIDADGFIYTVSNYGEAEQKGQVRKLNPLSQNILFMGKKPDLMYFGDWESTYTNRVEKSSLIAVDIDKDNFINVLDFERGRVFQYDQSCNLIAIFGGPGDQKGTFRNAADLVSSKGRILVLDNVKGSITSFVPTRYGEAIHKGTVLYENGFYEEALQPWYEALKLDRNNHLTMRGIARAYERLGRYEEAMDFWKQAQYHGSYSESFREWRTEFLRDNFAILASVIALIVASFFFVPALRRRFGKPKSLDRAVYVSKLRFPFYLILHPFKGWEELKDEKQGSLLYANIILVVWFVVCVIDYQFSGFPFNFNRPDKLNLLITLANTVGFALLWSMTNWGVCTLSDGKGTFKEVWIFTAYTRTLVTVATVPLVILSNVLAKEEGFFLGLAWTVVDWYGMLQMLLAVKAVHQYTLKHTLFSILLTVIGCVLVILVILLFVSLGAQMYSFGSTIFQEILMRI